jgi:hypothetical protein
MATAFVNPIVQIDLTQPYTVGQKSIIGPFTSNVTIIAATFNGNTATVPVIESGTYDGTTFTANAGLVVSGLDGGGVNSLGATTAVYAVGTDVAIVTPTVAAVQYLRITSGTNALSRVRIQYCATTRGSLATSTNPA